MPGPTEWIVIGVVLLLLFGAKKVPEMARALGRTRGEFEKGLRDEETEPTDAP